jgi:serine/threonine-protein kinase
VLKNVSHAGLSAPDLAAPQRAIPPELSAVCMKALAREKVGRYGAVVELARDIRSYLDGRMVAAYHYNLLQVIGKQLWRHRWPLAAGMALIATALGAWGYTRHAERAERLSKAGQFREKAAGDAERKAYESAVENFQQALAVLPGDEERTREELRASLGEAYFELFRLAEAAENDELAVTYGKLACREAPGKYDQIIQGDGVLDLSTGVPAQVQLLRALEPPLLGETVEAPPDSFAGFDSNARADLGSTPIENRKIAMGSWLLVIRASGYGDVRLPLWVGRNEHVRIENLRLLKLEETPPGMVYAPAGLWLSGAPRSVRDIVGAPPLRQQAHAGFLIGEREVTNEQWWEFIQDKMKTDPAGWSRYRPLTEKRGQEVFNWTPDDATDPNKAEDWRRKKALPVVGITHDAAAEYARFRGARLPSEEEWEVAARGADGRLFAWGNRADSHKANVYDTFDMPDRRTPGAMPFDRSPYGVLDMTGNVSEWTSTWYDEARKEYTVCGANFSSRRGEEMLLLRRPCVASKSQDWIGFRIAMDLPAVDQQPKRANKW